MSFVSPQFAGFLLAFVALYFAAPLRARTWLILGASYIFYGAWNWMYLGLIVTSSLVDYFAALRISRLPSRNVRARRLTLAASIALNLGILFAFKYFDFFSASLHALLTSMGLRVDLVILDLLLPVGISFYTFQSMSYTIDVYRGQLEPERNLVRFLAYVAFFPQLVAGPIERASRLLPQFRVAHRFDRMRTVDGMRWILWGAFKKLAIADRLAIYVNTVYDAPERFNGPALLLATIFFGFQVYADFSGYTDIAVGSARILGFDLIQNFKQPYWSTSVREFWRRWHISLWTWFRDYLYIPLGGNRVPFAQQLRNVMIVYLVSGLWHGASWTFVMWGAINGMWVGLEMILDRYQVGRRLGIRIPAAAGWMIMLLVISCSRVFFRAETMADAGYILSHLFTFNAALGGLTAPFQDAVLAPRSELLLAIGGVLLLLSADLLALRRADDLALLRQPSRPLRWATYYVLGFGVLLSVAYGLSTQAFIYFQF
jgi:alginate O-acetyltransferase complex protein AlgI